MIKKEVLVYLKSLDSKLYKHASNILAKVNQWEKLKENQIKALPIIVDEYLNFSKENNVLKGFSDEIITKRVALLNKYYDL